jgi:serine/threonine-protein kinase RsbW
MRTADLAQAGRSGRRVWDRPPEGQRFKRAKWPGSAVEVDGVEVKMVLNLPRDAASVTVSRQVLDSCLQRLGVTPDTRDDIALALSEACANVILHAGPGQEYEVQVSVGDGRCAIEVINSGPAPGDGQTGGPADDRWTGEDVTASGDLLAATPEHGRGLKIIDAVVDNLQLTGSDRLGRTVSFEKKLAWLPGAPGQHLFNGDG